MYIVYTENQNAKFRISDLKTLKYTFLKYFDDILKNKTAILDSLFWNFKISDPENDSENAKKMILKICYYSL